MKYEFPVITHIDDVLPHVENREEFSVTHKGEGQGAYTIINYNMMTSDTFRPFTGEDDLGNAIRRECRGLIFDVNGKLIRRPLHKFFNLQEREETLIENIDFNQIVAIHQKLDGSMIAPFITADGITRFGTKAGETDVSAQALAFIMLPENSWILRFCFDSTKSGLTPIFEWCSRENRVVIDHPEPKLILLAVRDNQSGRYYSKEWFNVWNKTYNIPFVDQLDTTFASFEQLMEHTRGLIGEEGYVVEFRDGHRVKTKGSWYLAIHKAKEKLLYERYVIEMILDEQTDDVLPFLLDTDKQRLVDYQDAFHGFLTKSLAVYAAGMWKDIKDDKLSRKDFALNRAAEYEPFHSIVFRHYESFDGFNHIGQWTDLFYEEAVKFIRTQCNSNTRLASFKEKSGFTYQW